MPETKRESRVLSARRLGLGFAGLTALVSVALAGRLVLVASRSTPVAELLASHAVEGGKLNRLPADDGKAGEQFVIGLYGDPQGNRRDHESTARLIEAMLPQIVAMSGDCINDPSSSRDWARFLEASAPLRGKYPYLVARGNHDRGETWERAFATPSGESNYALDFRHMRLVVMDTERRTSPDSEQGRWLKAQLEKSKSRPFTVVLSHKPVISSGDYYTDDRSEASEDAKRLGPLFLETGVDLSLSGHEHFYERLEQGGLTFVVSGGAGQSLREASAVHASSKVFSKTRHVCRLVVRADRMEITAIGIEGTVLDACTVSPR